MNSLLHSILQVQGVGKVEVEEVVGSVGKGRQQVVVLPILEALGVPASQVCENVITTTGLRSSFLRI